MNNQPIKIQINSREALERLIGGDSQLEISIRKSIVHDFTSIHLKKLATVELMGRVQSDITNALTNEFFNITKDTWGSQKYSLKEEARKKLYEMAGFAVNDALGEIIETKIKEIVDYGKINELILKQAIFISDQLTDTVISSRLEKMVDSEIKKRLGIK